jgi:hypothetical protein
MIAWLGGYALAAAALGIISTKTAEMIAHDVGDTVKGAVFRYIVRPSDDTGSEKKSRQNSSGLASEILRRIK